MDLKRVVRAVVAVVLLITIQAPTMAQEGFPGPEGGRWDLTAYRADGGLVEVPWNVDATLSLEEGTAEGTSGCDRFDGGYALGGESLTFFGTSATTGTVCTGDSETVKMAYMAHLPQVASWAIVDDVLQLSDTSGSVILEFAEPMVGFTTNDISALARILAAQQADIDRLAERLDDVRIGKLRDRVKALEARVSRLKASATAGEQSTSTFTAAERVLLTAIPARTRQTCEPRRDQNPEGTVAAVQCKPATAKVRDMAYYLMNGPDADTVYQMRMDAYGAKPGFDRCARGKPGDIVFTGGFQASGCYLNEDGRANLRYVVSPWDNCMNLKAGRTRIKHPTLYIAVLGPDADIASLTDWAEPKGDARPRALFKPFRRRVDACGFTPPT